MYIELVVLALILFSKLLKVILLGHFAPILRETKPKIQTARILEPVRPYFFCEN